ncbi:hypothetical protein ACFOOM_23340 [Streptomyces echinoruber]|uniref:Uncharacterized protein n=1 Tax=Streptomyces echinoruber TaxID=68898 RepID=A0A918VEG3_9ACTN|nr:hypothetical protein [Streptomyces echinoruber]GGZ92009.1 hypothetical protein GCM10010389_33230 [Streptomyces echinoruber]
MAAETDVFFWPDVPSSGTRDVRPVPEEAAAERDDAPGAVGAIGAIGDATAWTLFGMVFASMASGRPAALRRFGDGRGGSS